MDLEPLAEVYCQAFLPFRPSNISKETNIKNMKDYFLNELQQKLVQYESIQECMVETETNDYVAYFSAYENPNSDTGDSFVHIPEIFVNPDYQKFGHARAIMRDGLALCSARFENSEWIDLNTQPYNKRAIKLYKGMGFEVMFVIKHSPSYYVIGPDNEKYDIIRMAKPLHEDFAFRQYPNFDPSNDNKPIIENYFTRDTKHTETYIKKDKFNENVELINEAATYPVKFYDKYKKDYYGEMIRFQYGVYEDDMSLSKKEVNRRAKRDASTLLSAQEKLPDFTVWCGITDVSIAAYIVVAKLNGVWTFTMDHYYDTDGKVLKKLVDKAVSLTKLKELKGQEDFILESMMKVDGLRDKSKTKYRSVFKINDEFLNSIKQQDQEIPEEKPEEEPVQPTGEEIPQEKGPEQPNVQQPQVQPIQPTKPEFQTPIPAAAPEEPELSNYDQFVKDKEKKQTQLAKDIKTQIQKTSKQKLQEPQLRDIPEPEEEPEFKLPELPDQATNQPEKDSNQIVKDVKKVSKEEPKEDNLEDLGEFPPTMFAEPEKKEPDQELPSRPAVKPVMRNTGNVTSKVINDLPKGRNISPVQIIDVDNITNPDISGNNKQEEKRDAVQNIMNPEIKK